MFRFSKLVAQPFQRKLFTHCEDSQDDGEGDGYLTSISDADQFIEEGKKSRPPMQFANVRGTIGQGAVDSYEGFRFILQKQINLNTVVSHFYWLGSTQIGAPIYQYRLILPIDDNLVAQIATDLDFNIEGDVKAQIENPFVKNLGTTMKFAIQEQKKSFGIGMDFNLDDKSSTALHYNADEGATVTLGHMQGITKELSLGGQGQYDMEGKQFVTSIGGVYDTEHHMFAGLWENCSLGGSLKNVKLLYLRRVNPNRVNMTTDLVVDSEGGSLASVGVEYQLQQSKIQMSIDSNMEIKSTLETTIGPRLQMQFSAEMAHMKNVYRFGYGLVMS